MRIDAVYVNGHIRTLDPDRPHAQRLGVLHGRIVGLDEELDGVVAEQVVDLCGAHVLPGFHDAHHHLSATGERLASLDLRPGRVDTLDKLYAAVRAHARTHAPGAWVRGAGYDQNVLGAHPTAEALDRAADGRPVVLEHVSGHMLAASTEVFARAGHPGREGVPDVAGGIVNRDAEGRAEGLLQERAMALAHDLVRPLSTEQIVHHLDLASRHALAHGITSVTDPGLGDPKNLGNSPADLHAYQVAREQGVQGPRTTVMPYLTTLHPLAGFAEEDEWFGLDLGLRTGFGDGRLRMGPVKVFADGSLIGKSAAMHRCYDGEPANQGTMRIEPAQLRRQVVAAHRAGWSVAVHAIGDAAIDHALDAIEAAVRADERPNARHRIEHFAVADDSQVARAAALGVVAVPQGRFISEFGDGMARVLGSDRAALCYRMRSLLRAGMVLPGSTDSPVADASVLQCIHDMVNRRTASGSVLAPGEELTVEEAVRAYTYGSAYAEGGEADKGALRAGMYADFVVLAEDVFQVDPERIRAVEVVATVLGGEPVHGEEEMGG